jgi:hypothetical protein
MGVGVVVGIAIVAVGGIGVDVGGMDVSVGGTAVKVGQGVTVETGGSVGGIVVRLATAFGIETGDAQLTRPKTAIKPINKVMLYLFNPNHPFRADARRLPHWR